VLQVASKKQQLPYSKADVLRSFRMFADRGAPPGCIVPETLEAALVSISDAAATSNHVCTTAAQTVCAVQRKMVLLFALSAARKFTHNALLLLQAALSTMSTMQTWLHMCCCMQLKHCQHMLDADEIARLVHTLEVQPDGYIHFKDLVQLFMNT
jgi:hypothetical protein